MKKLFSNPYVIAILGGVIVALITDGIGWTSIWSFLWNKVIVFFFNDILLYKLTMPLWILVLIAFLFIFLIYKTWRKPIVDVVNIPDEKEKVKKHIKSYKSDMFEGYLYYWRWIEEIDGRLVIDSESVMCPKCMCQLVPDRYEFRCPNCKRKVLSSKLLSKPSLHALIQLKLAEKHKNGF